MLYISELLDHAHKKIIFLFFFCTFQTVKSRHKVCRLVIKIREIDVRVKGMMLYQSSLDESRERPGQLSSGLPFFLFFSSSYYFYCLQYFDCRTKTETVRNTTNSKQKKTANRFMYIYSCWNKGARGSMGWWTIATAEFSCKTLNQFGEECVPQFDLQGCRCTVFMKEQLTIWTGAGNVGQWRGYGAQVISRSCGHMGKESNQCNF